MSTTILNSSKSIENSNIKYWLNKKYSNVSQLFTDENIKNAILTLSEYLRDENGNYTGSEQLLLTPFGGISDLEKIKNIIIDNINKS
jgi:hypothetical protein